MSSLMLLVLICVFLLELLRYDRDTHGTALLGKERRGRVI